MKITVEELYHLLLKHLGDPGWWPADSLYEIMIGAILIQNTNWHNVALSLRKLKEQQLLIPQNMFQLSAEDLKPLIRSSGFYQAKSRSIISLTDWLSQYQFDLASISQKPIKELRQELLEIKGIGNETADVLLLYVFQKNVFVVDTYTKRIFNQLGYLDTKQDRLFQQKVETNLSLTLSEQQMFHGLLDEFAKLYLRKNREQWDTSFLADYQLDL